MTTSERSRAEIEGDIDEFMHDEGSTGAAPAPQRRAARPRRAPKRKPKKPRPRKPRSIKRKSSRATAKSSTASKKRGGSASRASKKTTRRTPRKTPRKTKKVGVKTKKVKAKKTKEVTGRARRATRARRASSQRVPEPTPSLSTVVMEAVTTAPSSERFGPSKVFIYPIWRRVKKRVEVTLPEFKRWLLDQNRMRHLDLARADLVGAMDPDLVRESEIVDMGSTFHFVLDPTARGW